MAEDKKPRKPMIRYSTGKPKLRRGRKATPSRTSNAKAKRKAAGLQPSTKSAAIVGGYARTIDAAAPTTHPETRQQLARIMANNPEVQRPVIKALVAQEQQLVVKMRQSLMRAAPNAADYLADLVNGVHESAPHAVRAGAAGKIIDSAIDFAEKHGGNKHLSEMSADEIQAELQALTHALSSQTAEDAELVEDEPGKPK